MRKLLCGICLFVSSLQVKGEDVSVILKRMDAAAPAFHSMSADIQMVTVTAIINDKVTENGTLKMQRGKNGSVRAVYDFPGQKVIGLFGKTVRIYYPKNDYYQDYDLGKNSDLLNEFLLLGFGSSGEELAKSYTITPEGTEKVSGSTTTKLLLIPKDPHVKEHVSKIEIWIPEGQTDPIQQEFYEPNDNYRIVTYSNIQLNPAIKGDLVIKMQPSTKKRSSQ